MWVRINIVFAYTERWLINSGSQERLPTPLISPLKQHQFCTLPLFLYMQQNPLCQANSSSPSQKIPRMLCTTKVHNCVHNSPSLVSIVTIQTTPLSPNPILKIHFDIILPSPPKSFSSLFLQISLWKSCTHFPSPPYVPPSVPKHQFYRRLIRTFPFVWCTPDTHIKV